MTILLGDTQPVARKGHYCDVCSGTIAPGDTYRRQRVIWEGEPGIFKCHLLCDAAYWMAYREMELMDDEMPDWTEDIKPLVERFFTNLTGFGGDE